MPLLSITVAESSAEHIVSRTSANLISQTLTRKLTTLFSPEYINTTILMPNGIQKSDAQHTHTHTRLKALCPGLPG